jgi:hypothetical protein
MISFFVFTAPKIVVLFVLVKLKLNNIYIVVFYISKVVGKVTAYAALDYGTTDAQTNKSYFNSIHFHRSNTRSLMNIILRVGEIFCRIPPY